MILPQHLRAWLLATWRRSRIEREMDAELRFHIECRAEDLVRRGLSPQEAERRARAEFGALEARKDECREALGFRTIDELRADLRYALRLLRRSPAFTLVAVVSLGLGIGANGAIFSLMEAALWKSVSVMQPNELRMVYWVAPFASVNYSIWDEMRVPSSAGRASASFSYPVFQELQRRHPGFQSLCAFKPIGRVTALIGGSSELITAHLVSGNFYRSLGVAPIAGRPIEPADDTRRGEPAAVMSDAFWARRFARDPSALGRRIGLNGVPFTIVGVNPPGFTGMQPGAKPDIFVPLTLQPQILPRAPRGSLLDTPDFWWLPIVGRLQPGVDQAQAEAALNVVLQQALGASFAGRNAQDRPRLRLMSGARGLDTLSYFLRKPLLVLAALAGLVLLLACGNVASLLLARATARQREVDMRLALGASRGRIARQLLTEGLVLAALGGACGMLLGYLARNGIPWLLATGWTESPVQAEFDAHVVWIMLGVALLSGLVFSMLPVWHSIRADVNPALKDSVRATAGLSRRIAGKALVVGQVCLSVMLLAGAGLFVRTLWNLKSADLGFHPEHVLLFTLDPPAGRYNEDQRKALFERTEVRLATLPGVQSASRSWVPMVAQSGSSTDVSVSPLPGQAKEAHFNQVGDRFFETMGIAILYGRPLGRQDGQASPPAAVVNQQFARVFFPHENPLGKMFHWAQRTTEQFRIVGICGDARYRDLRRAAPPTFYLAARQSPDFGGEMTFELKTAANEAEIVREFREAVRLMDRELPVFNIRTQRQQIDATLSQERLFAALAAASGTLALIVACLGVYGILANSVAHRTGEIGVRMALGAGPRQVFGLILREALLLAGAGILAGTLISAGLTRYVRSMLSGLEPVDPVTFGGATAIMLVTTLLAGWWPAHRASRLDPMAALRHE